MMDSLSIHPIDVPDLLAEYHQVPAPARHASYCKNAGVRGPSLGPIQTGEMERSQRHGHEAPLSGTMAMTIYYSSKNSTASFPQMAGVCV